MWKKGCGGMWKKGYGGIWERDMLHGRQTRQTFQRGGGGGPASSRINCYVLSRAFSDGGKTTRDVLAPTLHGPVKPQLAISQVGQGRLQLVPSLLVWPRGCKSSGQHVNVGILNSSTVNLPSTSLSSTLGPPSTTTPRVGPLKKDPEGYPRLPQRPSLPQAIRAPSAR
ncbi:hypothetical protein Pmani_029975 [Petrolisthes manimaculis]|uniref:Uncharacterized protein n=1 Tax=Petrolisthes manimaculis TaxID=1843537 RepID=A0AAE1NWJ4_9EUCA|nr:hypothetical protein Pmani_029975 [Petrolisthes manimaculis]